MIENNGETLATENPRTENKVEKSIIDFSTSSVAVMENVGSVNITIERRGKLHDEVTVKVDTVDGSAEEGDDYVGIHDIFTFVPGESEIQVNVKIIDDDQWEPDEEFFLKISLDPSSDNKSVIIGKKNIMTIITLNDDEPGTFGFDKRGHFVKVRCRG